MGFPQTIAENFSSKLQPWKNRVNSFKLQKKKKEEELVGK